TCLMCLYDSVYSCIAIHREATVKNYETGNKKTDDTRRYSSL
ncbi:IS481 family transposase, partial [Escherichia coli O45:H11]|nr:IS481 family transposase [Escherichia coli O45:H11]